VALGCIEIPTTTAEEVRTDIVESTALTVTNHPRRHFAGHHCLKEFVGSAITTAGTNCTEEWLLDSGATSGVTYDNSLMTDMHPPAARLKLVMET
jgi:hypothetical protein